MRILDQIDEFLNNQKDNEVKLFFFLPILLFGFLSYYFLYPITDENLTNSLNKNKQLNFDINNFTNQVNGYNRANMGLKRNITNMKKELEQLKKDKMAYDNLVKQLYFLRFDLVEWAKFYKNISFLAKKHHIVIYQLDNLVNESKTNKLIQKKMSIVMNANGDFVNFIKFMREFEKLKEFVKITAINMNINELKLTIEIYGAKL